ncbi:DUF6266 family protein [Pedobacter sp. P351]|uniref:DUF6266 family protein n=1 Tax=Pedobacter superstes TaxID=3133441 RepID=UPI00309CEE71
MGTYSKGILGSFSGKVGTVVGSNWNGIDYMRSLPKKSSKAPTDKQLEQRVKLALAVGFLKPVSPLLSIGFRKAAANSTGFNVATSLIVKEAITGTYPDYLIDYTKVMFSQGDLTGPWNAAASSADEAVLTLNWTDNTGSGNAKATDKAKLMIYNPAKSQYVYTTGTAARNAATEAITLPGSFSGDTVEVWMAFIVPFEDIDE